jgi:REP element-mobilizing transposase RayT
VHDAYARAVLEELRQHCDAHPAKLIAYVVMPTHLHAIVNPRDGGIVRFCQQWKAGATTAVLHAAHAAHHAAVVQWLTATATGQAQLWQDGKHNLHLYSEWMIWQKIHYIHNNPLRWHLAPHADAYPYSSFTAMYYPERPVIIPIDRDWWWTETEVTT